MKWKFRHQGQIGAALVLGGIDQTGPHLYTVAPHGSTDKLPYVTMGSGSLAAMAIFETQWHAKLTKAEAMELVSDAIEAGIFNDLGSGSNVDVCVIEESGTELIRGFKRPNERVNKEIKYTFRRGTTAVVREGAFDFRLLLLFVSTDTLASANRGNQVCGQGGDTCCGRSGGDGSGCLRFARLLSMAMLLLFVILRASVAPALKAQRSPSPKKNARISSS